MLLGPVLLAQSAAGAAEYLAKIIKPSELERLVVPTVAAPVFVPWVLGWFLLAFGIWLHENQLGQPVCSEAIDYPEKEGPVRLDLNIDPPLVSRA